MTNYVLESLRVARVLLLLPQALLHTVPELNIGGGPEQIKVRTRYSKSKQGLHTVIDDICDK